jgi:hypothetical protein
MMAAVQERWVSHVIDHNKADAVAGLMFMLEHRTG